MATFVIPKHRTTKAITLTRPHGEKLTASVTLRTGGKRTIELGPELCTKYADSLDALIMSGDLILVG